MASKNTSTNNEDDDAVWEHKPLKRVKKSFNQFPSSQPQNTKSASSSSIHNVSTRDEGIPHSQCSGTGSAGGGVTPSQRGSHHQSHGEIVDSSQKLNKRDCAIKPSQSSVKKSWKIPQSQINKSQKRKTESESAEKKTEAKNQEYCPICQAPFSSIHLSSLEGHIEDCLEFEKPDIECPQSLSCDVTILSHYQKFSHNMLALARSEMTPNDLLMMEEDERRAESDMFTPLKAEGMPSSDSDFERPSSSTQQTFRTRSTPHEDYEFTIKGGRVTCTPKGPCSSQVSASQSKPQSKPKNTARKSIKGAINRNQRNCDRMEVVKEEMLTPNPQNKRESKASYATNQENTSKDKLKNGPYQSIQTPSSQSKSAAKSGNPSKKLCRRKSSTWDDIPTSRSLLDYFSPSQKTAGARLNGDPHSPLLNGEMTLHPSSVSEDSQPFVESDVDIFEVDDNEPLCGDRNSVVKSEALTTSDDCKDQFTKLHVKPKQDMKKIPGALNDLGNDAGKPSDEPFFDVLDTLEDATGEESESPFSSQNSNVDEDNTTLRNHAKMSNFVEVPPAPVQDDDTSDDELPQFDLTCRSLEELSDENREKTSNLGDQGSTSDGRRNDQETMEVGSQDEESESLFNIPSGNKQIELPTLDHDQGKLDNVVGFSQDEESQSLFNIPSENKEQQCLAVDNHPGNLDNAEVCSENEEEESQSLFNIPGENKEQQCLAVDNHPGKLDNTEVCSEPEEEESQSLLHIPGGCKEQQCLAVDNRPGKLDNTEVCSENKEEKMEVDNEEEEQTNKEERSLVSGWRASGTASAMSAKEEDCSRPANINTSTTAQAVAKPRKQETLDFFLGCKPLPKPGMQGTLDSFLGCKPAPKVEPPAQKAQPKGQWTGSRQSYQKSKGEGQGRKEWGNSSGKQCPFYKKMPGTSFTVDAFRYGGIPGCKAYFLSHFHYDHYGGLTKHFDQQLYCSKITGNLVTSRLKVAAEYVINLPMNEPCIIDEVEVTLLDANHCPGSVMFLYKLKSGSIYLHVGDFRADAKMEQYPQLSCCRVNQLYLDTTYCDPQYKFPAQKEVLEFAVQTAVNAVRLNKKTLIVCGTYTIGKEKVFRAIAEALACKVYVESQKFKVLECLEDDELMSLLTRDSQASRLHVVGMNIFKHQKLKEYLSKLSPRYDHILAFKPTGWTHNDKAESPSDIKPSKSGPSTIYGIPYSEHSSYSEMKRFVQFLRPDNILPTVNNGNPKSRKAMEDIFERWREKDGRSSSPTKLQPGNINNWCKR